MARLEERMALAEKVLARLQKLVAQKELSDVERDALIQRFKFCFEIMWKCAKDYLLAEEGMALASPKKIIRASCEIGLLDEEQTVMALIMADDCNVIVHTYDGDLAREMAKKIITYAGILQYWYSRLG